MKIEDMMKNLELYHHGIKGQKWGVRRYQNYDGTRIKGDYRVLKEGTTVNKIAGREIKNFENKNTYVSHTPKDNKAYLDYANDLVKGQNYCIQNKYKTLKELKIPSDEVVTDRILNSGILNKAYMKLLDDGYTFTESYMDVYFEIDLSKFNKGIASDIEKKSLASEGFKALFKSGYMQEFVSSLAKEGYDAVKDLEDAPLWTDANNHWVEDPLIIFNPSETLKFEGSTKYNLES